MRASTIIAFAVGLTASIVSAQGLESIPQCALQCALTSLGSTGCDTSDIGCICRNEGFVSSLIPCVQGACSAAEFEATVQAAGGLCLAASVTLSVPTAAPTTAAPASSTAVSTTVTEVVSSMSTVVVSNTTTTAAPAPTGNGTVTQPPTPSGTDSAAGRNAVALGGLGAIAALVAALL